MRRFVRFTEYNDWEGEEWTFWLQVEGNETALEQLGRDIEGREDQYRLHSETLEEHDVDVLVEHGGSGYMNKHNKLTGNLILPDKLVFNEDDDDPLYKGSLKNFFKKG